MSRFDLVVCDMAGTTVRDAEEVETCFTAAAREANVIATPEKILAMMGWSKRLVFEVLLKEQLGEGHPDLVKRIDGAYETFKRILEHHYETQAVEPTEGALDLFDFLRARRIPICLTTGFYRKVTNIILGRLGWNAGLDANYVGSADSLIRASISSDEVAQGRPAPDMILRAMRICGVTDPNRVLNVGDTPSDLQSGRNAGCGLSLGVINGTHTYYQLSKVPNDGLLSNISELKDYLI